VKNGKSKMEIKKSQNETFVAFTEYKWGSEKFRWDLTQRKKSEE
jgi:hypothetical protein